MSKDVLLIVFGIPVALGGVYMWSTGAKTRKQQLFVGLIIVYDFLFISIFHWWLKAF
jgi:hypothetical protein